MSVGRKPTSSAAKKLAGNPGRRPLNEREPILPVPDAGFDAPPPELDGHRFATAEWIRLAPMLRRNRQITDGDRSGLLALCLEWDRYLEATAQIRKTGLVVKAPSGYPIVNPYLSIATTALKGCSKLWPELGLTPSSRSRVSVAEPPEQAPSALQQLQAQGATMRRAGEPFH